MTAALDLIPLPLTDEHVREGWAELLSRYEWNAFATLTYANPVYSSEKVLRDISRWLWRWQLETAVERGLADRRLVGGGVDVYGNPREPRERYCGTWPNSYRKGRARPVYVVGVEPHRSGALHAHAIIRYSRMLPDLDRRHAWRLWHQPPDLGGFGHGLARIEPPRGQDDVASYVAKYVVKGGEVYVSPSFNARRLTAAF